ncbi:MAG: HAMP domain-containing histidine kinase [Hahellaceae bacterium]|nr:HAMP domain-containing histidine kinase [Hahellaceae bacterium]MCP5209731.1 HAMP domain-containing histidine kinase [Hahellaceae bacterium]
MMRNSFRSFYSKLALVLLASFIFVGIFLMVLVEHLTISYQNEVEQKLHHQLAAHVVKDHQLLKDGKIDHDALKQAFHNMMVLGPAFEFYVLDNEGVIQTYSADPGKVKRKRVDLEPIHDFLADKPLLPIVGDDPRVLDREKIFSVAEIKQNDLRIGYLYIIIGGEIYDDVVDVLKSSHIIKLGVWGFIAALCFILISLMVIFAMLTQPLRRLTADMRLFHEQGFEKADISLTEWQSTGDEIHRLGATFTAMASELKAQYEKVKTTDELRKELISYVSHDLRTPLAALLGYLETWQMSKDSLSAEESDRLIQIAIDNGHHISYLVEQLFELARLDSNNAAIDMEPVALTDLAYDVIQSLSLIAQEKGVVLEVIKPDNDSMMALADVPKLERVLTNLLDNAIRHCESGDSVTVELAKIDQTNHVSITVADTGRGIPKEDLPHIFNAHYRARNSAKSKKGNTGLGLAITRKILQLHNSDIRVESTEGAGARFTFELLSPK